jgi:hypothetical protein
MSSWGDNPVANEALDPSIRPPSNFDARSNPFKVNGGGGQGLNPGGDLLSAYWLLRYLPVREAGSAAQSPLARNHIWLGDPPFSPEPRVEPSAETDTNDVAEHFTGSEMSDETITADATAGPQKKSSSKGCSAGPSGSVFPTFLLLLLVALALTATRRHYD